VSAVAGRHPRPGLVLLDQTRLSSGALAALEQAIASGDLIRVSAISVVEIVYLVDRGKLPELALTRLVDELNRPDPSLICVPVDLGIAEAVRSIPRDLVPDMPDRIIAATPCI
jgi:PIN domain nuclease of toxin-antitoxin system